MNISKAGFIFVWLIPIVDTILSLDEIRRYNPIIIVSCAIAFIPAVVITLLVLFDDRKKSKPKPIRGKKLNIFSYEQLSLWDAWKMYKSIYQKDVIVDEEIPKMFGEQRIIENFTYLPDAEKYELSNKFVNVVNGVFIEDNHETQESYMKRRENERMTNADADEYKTNTPMSIRNISNNDILLSTYINSETDDDKYNATIQYNSRYQQRKLDDLGDLDAMWRNAENVLDMRLNEIKPYELQQRLCNFLDDDDVYLKEKEIFEDSNKTAEYELLFRKRFRKSSIKSSAAYKDYLLKTITSKYMCCVPSDNKYGYENNPVKKICFDGRIGADNMYEEYAVKEFEMLGISINQ